MFLKVGVAGLVFLGVARKLRGTGRFYFLLVWRETVETEPSEGKGCYLLDPPKTYYYSLLISLI